tara:strand:- start:1084 stop:1512 length:429 start_codon:yes stop_codon:yes gene_type:complete
MNKYETSREIWIKQNKVHIFDHAFNNVCELIVRQTDYDIVMAKEKLIRHDMNTLLVIKEWMGIDVKTETIKKSTNQMVFDEFRTFLTEASLKFKDKQEAEKNFKKAAEEELNRRKNLASINENKEEEDENNSKSSSEDIIQL